MGALLVILFITFVAIGVPISFALGVVSFTGIMSMPTIPNTVVFTKMFNGMNSFTLLAVPLFILAANLMNEGDITDRLVACSNALVGRFRGGLAYSNVLVSMVFGGISGSSQADTAGIGSILIPAMIDTGYDEGTAVGVPQPPRHLDRSSLRVSPWLCMRVSQTARRVRSSCRVSFLASSSVFHRWLS